MPPKPDKRLFPRAYKAWVRRALKDWDPSDDRGGPDTYHPRHNGVRAADVENAERREERHDVEDA